MISPDQAARLAASHLGGRLRAEPFGDGRFSETFLLQSRDSTGNGIDSGPHSGANPTPAQEYIMRIAPSDELLQLFYEYRMMRQEPSLHSLIRSRTSLPVPEIRAHDFSRSLINRDYLIMPRLPGTPLSSAALSGAARDHALFTWGSHIRTLHGIQADPGHFGYLGEHRPMEPQPSWPQAFLEMYRLELEDIRRCGIYGREECDYALSLLRENMTSFPELPAAILCHGDIWVTNLLVDSAGAVTGLIDFDRACWGDPEWDLAIADYCGVTDDVFLRGYGGDPRSGDSETGIRRMFYLLYEHQKYIVIAMSGRRNDPGGARRYAEQSMNIMRRFEKTGVPAI